MDEMLLQIPGEIRKVETKRNKSLRITFDTQEGIQPGVRSKIMEHIEELGWFTFLPGEKVIEPEDVLHDLPAISTDRTEKSPSQRLRAVLFLLWEKNGKPNPMNAESDEKAFEFYYRGKMEQVIDRFKEHLD